MYILHDQSTAIKLNDHTSHIIKAIINAKTTNRNYQTEKPKERDSTKPHQNHLFQCNASSIVRLRFSIKN